MALSSRSVRLLDVAGAACATLALVPPHHLSPEERSAWQCVGLFIVVSLVAAVEVIRAEPAPGRARRVFGRTCWMALPGVGAAVVLSMAGGPCAPWAAAWNAGWALLPTLGFAASVGVFAGSLSRGPTGAVGIIAAAVVAFFAHDIAWAFGSASYLAFDHLGVWSVESSASTQQLFLPHRAVAFRLTTLCWAAVLVAAVSGQPLGSGRRLARAVAFPLGAAAGLGMLALGTGLLHTHGTLALRLGDRAEVSGYLVHYERSIPEADRALFEEELRFHHHQLRPLFGDSFRRPVRVFVYASPESLVALTGADRSAFAFPYHLALHVALEPAPHSALRHELVHVLASAWSGTRSGQPGSWPFGEELGGLVEGLAEALGDPEPSRTLHRAAAAMKALELLPDARALMGDGGFDLHEEDLAYLASGSFVRFVLDRHGVQAVRALYGNADYASATGASLEELAAAWEDFLGTVPVSERALALAGEQYDRPQPGEAPCWREAEACRREGWGAVDVFAAEGAYRTCLGARPGDLECRLGLAQALRNQWRLDEAWGLLSRVLEEVPVDSPRRARAQLLAGHLALARGSHEIAAAHFAHAQQGDFDPWVTLEARVFWELAETEEDDRFARNLQDSVMDGVVAQLRRGVAREPPPPFGTRLALWWLTREEGRPLAEELLRSGSDGLLPEGAREALVEELVRQAWREDDCATVERLLVAELDSSPGRGELARHFRDRCAFRDGSTPAQAGATDP